jgi:hypothetical protein
MALCEKWGIDGSVYSHSVGVGGHGIGAWMNPSWPDRYGIRPTFPLRVGAVYAVESHATTVIPEWGGQKLRINTEEDVVLTEEGFKYVVPRQEKIHIIQSSVDPNVRFTDNGDGTATDTRTGLMWTIEDNGSNADWNAANVHCQTLALADHGDWRMPTVEELEALHFEGRAISNCHEIEGKSIPCYIYKPFTLSGMSMWSSNKRDASSAWLFSFYLGQRAISTLDRTGTRRVLCVRSPWTGDGPRQIER